MGPQDGLVGCEQRVAVVLGYQAPALALLQLLGMGDRRRGSRYSKGNPWVAKIPWRRAPQPSPVFLPGESHGQRNLAGYSPRGRKESDKTERLN